jgi:hypothetical protein
MSVWEGDRDAPQRVEFTFGSLTGCSRCPKPTFARDHRNLPRCPLCIWQGLHLSAAEKPHKPDEDDPLVALGRELLRG